jgi:ribulose-5-phosphate 4-epimerase/fuculose-1-phosphate aldolase
MSHCAQVVQLNALIRSDAGEYLFFYAVNGSHMSFYRIKPDQVHALNDDGEHFENMLDSEYEDWGIFNSMSFTDILQKEE